MSKPRSTGATSSIQEHRGARLWPVIVKVAGTTAILAFLFSWVDLSGCMAAIRQSHSTWLGAAFVLNVFALITSTWKWDVLLRALGIFTRKGKLLRLYTIGFFMNACLPGVIGGDVVRCQLAGTNFGGRLNVGATIVAERLIGLSGLVLMCMVALAWDARRLATAPILTLLGGVSAALVGAVIIVLNRRLATVCMYGMRRFRVRPLARILHRLHRTLRTFPRRALLSALGWTLLFYMGCGVTMYFICTAFSVAISVVEATTVLLFVCLLTLIPISIGGLGIIQAGDVYMFGIMGISPEQALGISLVRQLINYSYVLVGGVVFIHWRGNTRVTEVGAGVHREDPAANPLADPDIKGVRQVK